MKGITTFAFAMGLLSSSTDAITLQKRTDGPPRVVGFPIQRKSVPDSKVRDRLRRRSDTVQATLDNEATLYFANATLGTPAQHVSLHLDTGSSDLWVNTPESALCRSQGDPCSTAGTYSANASSTYTYLTSDFNISYVDGSGASGDYVTDTFTLDGTTLPTLQFGIGYTSSANEGILGIGYAINEVQVGRAGQPAYNNLPAQLVAGGLIQSNAYSLWLNDLDANTGSILFGGVDTAKYTGTLETLPIQKENGVFAEFLITLTEVTLGNTVIASNQAQAVLLDSGTSLTYLPDALAAAIYEQVGGEYDTSEGTAYVPCSLATNKTTLDFTFSSPIISVAMRELVIDITNSDGRPVIFKDGTQACLFGIAPAGSGTVVLGDTFMRSAYLVYDLANNEISIAQTDFNATATDIVEIGTGSNSIPNASLVANAATASGGSNSGTVSGTVTLGAGVGATSTAHGAAPTAGPSRNLGAMAAVGMGIAYAAM